MALSNEQIVALTKDLVSLQEYGIMRSRPDYKTPREHQAELIAQASAYPDLLKGVYQDVELMNKVYTEFTNKYDPTLSIVDHPDKKEKPHMLIELNSAILAWMDGDEKEALNIKLMLGLNKDTTEHDLLVHIHKITEKVNDYLDMVDDLHEEIKNKQNAIRNKIDSGRKIATDVQGEIRMRIIDAAHMYMQLDTLNNWMKEQERINPTEAEISTFMQIHDHIKPVDSLLSEITQCMKNETHTTTTAKFLSAQSELGIAYRKINILMKKLPEAHTGQVVKRFAGNTPSDATRACLEVWKAAKEKAAQYMAEAQADEGAQVKLPAIKTLGLRSRQTHTK